MQALTYSSMKFMNTSEYADPIVCFNEFGQWYSVCKCGHKDGVKTLEAGKARNIVCTNCGASMTVTLNVEGGTATVICTPWSPKKEWNVAIRKPGIAAMNEANIPSMDKNGIVSMGEAFDRLGNLMDAMPRK